MHNKHWEDMIPFYVAGSMTFQDRAEFEAHLSGCMKCSHLLEEWRSIATVVWQNAHDSTQGLPPLSQKVRQSVLDTSIQRQALVQSKANVIPEQVILQFPEQSSGISRYRSSYEDKIPKAISQIPLTMVAVSAVVLLIVGLLIMTSTSRETAEEDMTNVAALSSIFTETPAATVTQQSSIRMTPTGMSIPSPVSIPSITPMPDDVLYGSGIGGGEQDETALDQSFANNPTLQFTPAVQTTACYGVNVQDTIVNLYEFPSIQYGIVGQLNPDERVEVYVTSENGWYQTLRVSDRSAQRGWIDGELIRLEGLCDALPLPTPTHTTNLTPVNQMCIVSSETGDEVQIYAGPGSSYPILTTLSGQATATAQAVSDNEWYRVNYTALSTNWIGWVNGDDIVLNFNCDNLPVVQSESYSPELTPTRNRVTPLPSSVPDTGAVPEVVQFIAVENNITPGGSVTLRWETRNAESVWIEYYAPSNNPYTEGYQPLGAYSNLSPTGTVTIVIPEDYQAESIVFSLIVDTYDNEGRILGSTALVSVME